MFGPLHQPRQFLVRQCPTVVPPVKLHIEAAQVRQRVLAGPAVSPQPAGELLDRPQVVVAGLEGSPLLAALLRRPRLSNRAEGPLHRRRRDLADVLRLAQSQHVRYAGLDGLGLFDGDGLSLEGHDHVGQMVLQRLGLGGRIAVVLGVDDALAPKHGVGFEFAGERLGGRLILAALHGLSLARPHEVRDVVRPLLLTSVNAGHCQSSISSARH